MLDAQQPALVCAQGTGDTGATVPGAEGASGWGSSRFLSLLLVRVSLVSKGSALRGSWLRDLHTTGHTQLMPPTTATLLSCCRSPPAASTTPPSTAQRKATLTPGAGSHLHRERWIRCSWEHRQLFKHQGTGGRSCLGPGHHQNPTTRGGQQHTTQWELCRHTTTRTQTPR